MPIASNTAPVASPAEHIDWPGLLALISSASEPTGELPNVFSSAKSACDDPRGNPFPAEGV
jgi:hypothetical protein